MGKKTMVSIEGKGYKLTSGTVNKVSSNDTIVTFDKKIIAVLVYYAYNSATDCGCMYYMNESSDFWLKNGVDVSNLGIPESEWSYFYEDSACLIVRKVDDYSINVYQNFSSSSATVIKYIAILEDDSVGGDPMYLLNGTILYTNGTVTSDVSGAIETLETNKYKIKTNAVVNIADATYIDISN